MNVIQRFPSYKLNSIYNRFPYACKCIYDIKYNVCDLSVRISNANRWTYLTIWKIIYSNFIILLFDFSSNFYLKNLYYIIIYVHMPILGMCLNVTEMCIKLHYYIHVPWSWVTRLQFSYLYHCRGLEKPSLNARF